MAFSSTLTCWQKLLFTVMPRTANVDPRLVLMCWHLTRVVVLALDLCRYVEPRLVLMCCLSTCVDMLTLDLCQWVDPRLVSTCWLLTRVDVLRLNLCRCVDVSMCWWSTLRILFRNNCVLSNEGWTPDDTQRIAGMHHYNELLIRIITLWAFWNYDNDISLLLSRRGAIHE